jgi:hypothetical protein
MKGGTRGGCGFDDAARHGVGAVDVPCFERAMFAHVELSRIHDIFLFRRCEAKPKQSSRPTPQAGLLRLRLATTGYV